MINNEIVQNLIEIARRKQSILTPELDNRLFQAIALYFLENKISLPPELFLQNSHDSFDLKRIKSFFKDAESLEIFNIYSKNNKMNEEFPNQLVEKLHLLGYFFRSLFIEQLKMDKDNCEQVFGYSGEEADKTTFAQLIEDYQQAISFVAANSIISSEQAQINSINKFIENYKTNIIFESNKNFFENTNDEQLANLDYCYAYWEKTGYENYCNFLNTKFSIAAQDVTAILDKLKIPLTIKDSIETLEKGEGSKEVLPYLLAIDDKNQIFSFENGARSSLVQEFLNQKKMYELARDQLLQSDYLDKVEQARYSTALFLALSLPVEFRTQNALELLGSRLSEIQTVKQPLSQETIEVTKPESSNLIEETSPKTQINYQLLNSFSYSSSEEEPSALDIKLNEINEEVECLENIFKTSNSFEGQINDSVHFSEPETLAEQLENAYFVCIPSETNQIELTPQELKRLDQMKKIMTSLAALYAKSAEYNDKLNSPPQNLNDKQLQDYQYKYTEACSAAINLYESLANSVLLYLKSDKNKEDYDGLKLTSLEAIALYKPKLAEHRDWSKIAANLAGLITGLIVFYAVALAGNYLFKNCRNTFWQTDGEQKVDAYEDALAAIPFTAA
ncbi:MAG: hypothetical protein H0U70_04870 [Tatlockia sp.]|nr:hypothetical protein [Tatlockia sp.]